MMRLCLKPMGVFLAALGCALSDPVWAVDVVNRDPVARAVIVNRADGQSAMLTIKPGQKLNDVCNDCVVLVGNSSVEATGRVTVKIEGGKVSITSQR